MYHCSHDRLDYIYAILFTPTQFLNERQWCAVATLWEVDSKMHPTAVITLVLTIKHPVSKQVIHWVEIKTSTTIYRCSQRTYTDSFGVIIHHPTDLKGWTWFDSAIFWREIQTPTTIYRCSWRTLTGFFGVIIYHPTDTLARTLVGSAIFWRGILWGILHICEV